MAQTLSKALLKKFPAASDCGRVFLFGLHISGKIHECADNFYIAALREMHHSFTHLDVRVLKADLCQATIMAVFGLGYESDTRT